MQDDDTMPKRNETKQNETKDVGEIFLFLISHFSSYGMLFGIVVCVTLYRLSSSFFRT